MDLGAAVLYNPSAMDTSLLRRFLPRAKALLADKPRLVVACSGGPDSQALLDMLARLRRPLGLERLWAVGVDHQLRSAAPSELQHAAALAHRHDVPFVQLTVNVSRRGNRMQAARRARYRALRQYAHAHGAVGIALGHTADDQLETIVHHLCRGCALSGARGMLPTRGLLLRPLLHITRADIETYLTTHNIAYAQDPTNQDPGFTRTRIRTAVAPILRGINPQAALHMAQFAERAQQDDRLLMAQAAQRLRRAEAAFPHPMRPLSMAAIAAAPQPLATRMLALWLQQTGPVQVDSALLDSLWSARHADRGKWTRRNLLVIGDRGFYWRVTAEPHPWGQGSVGLPIPGNKLIPGWNGSVTAQLTPHNPDKMHLLGDMPGVAVAFDADRLHFHLGLRLWRSSDKLRPFGLDGTMKVGDLFTNTKIPQPLRATWPLVTHGENVLWVVGLRRGSDAPVTSETRRVVTLNFQGALPWSAC